MRRTVWEVETSLGTCNGVLLNNTGNDGRQLLLTARHCLRDEADFISVHLSDRLLDASDIRQVSWTTRDVSLLSSSVNLDYALYEILEPIPQHLLPLYAGWNSSPVQPRSLAGWHSLLGEKSLSEDLNRPEYQTLPALEEAEIDPISNGTWRVMRWERGYTDVGSSGSPVFNQWAQVVGILTAGGSTPEEPTNDLYSRFDLMAQELAPYITDGSKSSCDGLDFHKSTSGLEKYAAFAREDILFDIISANAFSESFDIPRCTLHGLYLPIADAGRNDDLLVTIRDEAGSVIYETTWSTRARLFGREHFLPLESALSLSAGQYEVSVTTDIGVNMYQAFASDGEITIDGGRQEGYSLLMSWLIATDDEGSDGLHVAETVVVYPNPVRDNLFIEGVGDSITIQIINTYGQPVRLPATTDGQNRKMIDFDGLPFGMYFLRLGESDAMRIFHR